MAGAAQDMPWIVAARAVQGTGAALMMSTALAIVSTVFPTAERGRALGILAGSAAFFAALGPVLGGLLTSIDWRLVFLINVPLAITTIVLTLRSTPDLEHDPGRRAPHRLPRRRHSGGWARGAARGAPVEGVQLEDPAVGRDLPRGRQGRGDVALGEGHDRPRAVREAERVSPARTRGRGGPPGGAARLSAAHLAAQSIRFQRMSTGLPCSTPITDSDAVPSLSACPANPPSWIQQAVKARERCPWPKRAMR